VSKLDPIVVTVAGPSAGASHANHTEAPPVLLFTWLGSPGSFVAPTVDPGAVPDSPVTAVGAENGSFGGALGGAATFQFTVTAPAAVVEPDFHPSTAIRYVVPTTAVNATLL